MSFDRTVLAPNQDTHVPVHVHVPTESSWSSERGILPTPSLWQPGVEVVHKDTGRKAAVRVVDYSTMTFRAHYPDTGEDDSRTTWQHCKEWSVSVTLSPAEQARIAAARQLQDEINALDPFELAHVEVLVDDPDSAKALRKLHALRALGIIKSRPEAVQAGIQQQAREPSGGGELRQQQQQVNANALDAQIQASKGSAK